MTYSVVIPSWKGVELLKKNLPAVLKIGAQEVIVVDDASPDGDSEFVLKNFPRVIVLKNERNYGFGTTVNRGVAVATSDIVILLNLDARPQGDILKFLEKDFQDSQVFAVSLAEDQFGPTERVFKNGYLAHRQREPRPDQVTPTFWVSGGSGAFRKFFWDELGGFDSRFDPFYWEDIDLCYRAEQKGWINLWDPRAKVEHVHESTIGKHIPSKYKIQIQERNHLLFTWKHLTFNQWPIHMGFLIARIFHHPGYLRVVVSAVARLVRHRPH